MICLHLKEPKLGKIFVSPAMALGDEVGAYLSCGAGATDVLEYWRQMTAVWPNLSKVARDLLGVPAISTPSERSLSLCGRTMEPSAAHDCQ